MKVAVVGSRNLRTNLIEVYLPQGVTEIVSGGADGIDACAREFALASEMKLTEFLPDYARYGRAAPLRRNEEIVRYAEAVLVFWDGESAGTAHVIELARRQRKPLRIVRLPKNTHDPMTTP